MVHSFSGFTLWSLVHRFILAEACGRGESSLQDGQEAEGDEGTGTRQNLHRPASKAPFPS